MKKYRTPDPLLPRVVIVLCLIGLIALVVYREFT